MDHTHTNKAVLTGTVVEAPRPSHVNHDLHYLIFPFSVRRLSGAADVVNVVVPQPLLLRRDIQPGTRCTINGEVRSYNNRSGTGSRLVITLLARELSPAAGADENRLELAGALCKPPTLRRTPLGREICDLLLAVNRTHGRSDYLPCIAWGALARACARQKTGDHLHLAGRLQSRKYRKVLEQGEEERTAYEISVLSLEPPSPNGVN